MSGPSKRDVVLLAALLDRHVTDAAFESGCRLSCGYDGDDLTRHMAKAILASDWLAERDAAIRAEAKAEALREAADALQHDMDSTAGARPLVAVIPRWLRDRAALLDGGDQS